MRMEQLNYLVDVAETKSMTKSAEHLFVSPQAVSKGIKQLEEELDTELLIRTNMGVELTRVGASIVALARTMLDVEASMKQVIAADKLRVQQENKFYIRICSTTAIINIVLPEILAQFAQTGIKIVPRIYLVDSLQDVLNHVEQGLCDLGLVTYNEEALFRKFVPYQYSLDMDFLAQDELVVVMAKENCPADQESLALQDFLDQFCTMFSTMPVESAVQSALDTQVTRSNNADFHRAMIKKAGAYVLMPRRAYEYFFGDEEYAAMPLTNSKPSLLHAAIYRKNAGEGLLGFAAMIRTAMQQQDK